MSDTASLFQDFFTKIWLYLNGNTLDLSFKFKNGTKKKKKNCGINSYNLGVQLTSEFLKAIDFIAMV